MPRARFASLLLLLLPVVAAAAVGCAGDDVKDDADNDNDDDEEEGAPVGPSGASCNNPASLADGPVQGSLADDDDDEATLSCNFAQTGTNELVYTFTLAEPAGVTVTAAGGDGVLGLFKDVCGAVELDCSDNSAGSTEELFETNLTAGTYYVVVEGYGGDDFSTTVSIDISPGGLCEGDFNDPGDESDAAATYVGAGDADTADFESVVCLDDVDTWLIAHMGGDLDVFFTGSSVPPFEVFTATVDEEASQGSLPDSGVFSGITRGDAVTQFGDMAAGYYLVRALGTGVPSAGIPYRFRVSHGCEGDSADFPGGLDDGVVTDFAPVIGASSTQEVNRFLCRGDIDTLVLDPVTGADITLQFVADAALDIAVSTREDGSDVEVDFVDFQDTIDGDTGVRRLVFSALDLDHNIVVRMGQTTPTLTTQPVTVDASVAFAPPSNDGCNNATPFTLGESVDGTTIGGSIGHLALCSGEADQPPAYWANDVFYAFTVAEGDDLTIDFAGGLDENDDPFYGTVALYQKPAGACPANTSTLVAIGANGQPTALRDDGFCYQDNTFVETVTDLAAGDYLVVVDGYPGFEFFPGFDFPPSNGDFSLTLSVTPEAP